MLLRDATSTVATLRGLVSHDLLSGYLQDGMVSGCLQEVRKRRAAFFARDLGKLHSVPANQGDDLLAVYVSTHG
jgi:hypothetical protein